MQRQHFSLTSRAISSISLFTWCIFFPVLVVKYSNLLRLIISALAAPSATGLDIITSARGTPVVIASEMMGLETCPRSHELFLLER